MDHRHDVSLLVTEPLPAVEHRFKNVESWASFLKDVEQITRVAHERYTFRIISGSHARDVPVAVREHPQQRCFLWTTLHGPSFDGSIRLADEGGGWTRVTVTLTRWPDGFLAGVTDMVLPGRDRTGIDESRLRDHLQAGAAPSRSASP